MWRVASCGFLACLLVGYWSHRSGHVPLNQIAGQAHFQVYKTATNFAEFAIKNYIPERFAHSREDRTLRLQRVFHHGSERGGYANLFRVLDAESLRGSDEIDQQNSVAHAEYAVKQRIPWASKISGEGDYPLPDVTDRETVLTLAKMSFDAYTRPSDADWVDIGDKWNTVFGESFLGFQDWEPTKTFSSIQTFDWGWASDGLRGYVFASRDTDLIVIVFKGTSAGFLGIGGAS